MDPRARCSRTVGRLGGVPRADLERTLNMGVGLRRGGARPPRQAASELLGARGIRTWVMGEVFAAADGPVEDGVEVVRGAKGVDGGSVQVVGAYPGPCTRTVTRLPRPVRQTMVICGP